jgi:hypothetical protein
MFSTSPYQSNDYQAASSYRPYRLPVNDIFKGLAAQNQFWDEGARKIKAYYDNALELNLTLDENKQVRKQFMDDAEKQISKLSSMNVADPSVQRQGMGIFKPLFQDEGILYDDFLTKKQGEIFSEAERYKRDEKTQGEGYHSDNLMYALKPFEGFNSTTKRGDLQGIYQRAKNSEYVPYHDVSKEYLDIASKCKPDKMSVNTVQGLYFHESTDNSQTPENLQGCIKAGLSDKGWQQLKITGSVRYGDNYPALGQEYSSVIQGNNKAYADMLSSLSAERKKMKDAGTLTKELDQAYTDQIGSINSAITNNSVTLNKINNGDYSDIKKDYDNIVAQVYANKDIGGFAQAFAQKDITEKYTANAAGIAQMRENGENARFNENYKLNVAKFQAEQQQKEKENDINLLKTLMDGKGNGSFGAGMDYQTYSTFMKPIFEKLGIANPDGITQFLDTGQKVSDVGQTYGDIVNKANEYHYNRVQAARGIYNVLKEMNVDGLDKNAFGENGAFNIKAVYELADKYLQTYHKTPGNGGKVDQIEALENLVNEYSDATSNAFQFIKMRDQINAKIATDPEVKERLNELNNQTESILKNRFTTRSLSTKNLFGNNPGAEKTNVSYFFTDQSGNPVIFEKDDMKHLADGTHPKYSFNTSGQLVDKITGQVIQQGGRSHNGDYIINQYEKHSGKQLLGMDNGTGVMRDISNIFLERQKKLQPVVGSVVQDVVRNSNVYNVANVPGLANTMKKEFSFLSEYAGDQYQFRPSVAKKDAAGNPITTVHVFKKDKVKDEDGTTEASWKDVTLDVVKDILKSNYAIGGSNNINIQNGELTVKTPYLPVFQGDNKFSDRVSNEVYAAKKLNLGYQEKVSSEIKAIPASGGFRIGFDTIGGGTTFNGTKNPDTYRTWIMLPDGTKEYIGNPLISENQISNQLSIVERELPRYMNSYNKNK